MPTRAEKSYITQTASLYLTAAELALRGFVVSVTTRNAPGPDIHATSPRKNAYGIQVKGNHWESDQSWWVTSKRAKSDSSPSYFYVFVNLKEPGVRPDFYIVPSKVVAERTLVKGGDWYGFDRDEAFKEKWNLLV